MNGVHLADIRWSSPTSAVHGIAGEALVEPNDWPVIDLDGHSRRFVPGVNCVVCGRFVGRDGSIEFERIDVYDVHVPVSGRCATHLAAARSGGTR